MKFEYDFSCFILPESELILLQKIQKLNKVAYKNEYDNLLETRLIDYNEYTQSDIGELIPVKDSIFITEKGLCYLQYVKQNNINNTLTIKIPLIISVLALVVSIFK